MRSVAHRFGLEIRNISSLLSDLSPVEQKIVMRVVPYTMTSLDKLAELLQAVTHVVENRVPGAFVECGVWKGGSSMAAALTYMKHNVRDVDLYLFDTFAGMPPPGEEDYNSGTGASAAELLAKADMESAVRARAGLDEVRRNLASTEYPAERLHYVEGLVEETVPEHAPEQISILRLDTDWYSSTKHELVHLYPRLSKNGVLILDDYGDWDGARKAVDEYFAAMEQKPLLHRIGASARIGVKV